MLCLAETVSAPMASSEQGSGVLSRHAQTASRTLNKAMQGEAPQLQQAIPCSRETRKKKKENLSKDTENVKKNH